MYVDGDYRAGYNPEFVKAVLAKRKAAKPDAQSDTVIDAEAMSADLAATTRDRPLPNWVKEIVRDVATEYGVLPSDLLGRSLASSAYLARRKAIYKVKECTPILTAGQIARWFQRDSTSVLYAVASYADDNGLPPLVTYNAAKRRRQWEEKRARK